MLLFYPILLFLSGWWLSIGLVPENKIFVIAILGFSIGILADLVLVWKKLTKIYEINIGLVIIIYLFYSICILGFFMGVPIFNLILGIIAGFFVGRRLKYSNLDNEEFNRSSRNTSIFTTAVILVISAISAFLALKDPLDTARNLQGMLGIQAFIITTPMIIVLIIVGGTTLAILQYCLTKFMAQIAYR
ncbi:MAG: hypothetical protein CVU90_03935 [Firmicutes bacterium HGW-Firmicutes-15]|nr:MAG: hypothetical protein CVU90_03935 [Firmicutes bacterium HGW-Firmicutes-15]